MRSPAFFGWEETCPAGDGDYSLTQLRRCRVMKRRRGLRDALERRGSAFLRRVRSGEAGQGSAGRFRTHDPPIVHSLWAQVRALAALASTHRDLRQLHPPVFTSRRVFRSISVYRFRPIWVARALRPASRNPYKIPYMMLSSYPVKMLQHGYNTSGMAPYLYEVSALSTTNALQCEAG